MIYPILSAQRAVDAPQFVVLKLSVVVDTRWLNPRPVGFPWTRNCAYSSLDTVRFLLVSIRLIMSFKPDGVAPLLLAARRSGDDGRDNGNGGHGAHHPHGVLFDSIRL
jgi:hypothetical protein